MTPRSRPSLNDDADAVAEVRRRLRTWSFSARAAAESALAEWAEQAGCPRRLLLRALAADAEEARR